MPTAYFHLLGIFVSGSTGTTFQIYISVLFNFRCFVKRSSIFQFFNSECYLQSQGKGDCFCQFLSNWIVRVIPYRAILCVVSFCVEIMGKYVHCILE